MRFARWTFGIAGAYGLLLIPPMYFLEARIGRDQPPPITHPEYYYGFLGVVVAWQIAFLIISRDPLRYRAIMLAAVVEKLSYAAATAVLFYQERIAHLLVVAGLIDLILGILFVFTFLETSRTDRRLTFASSAQQPTEAAGPLI